MGQIVLVQEPERNVVQSDAARRDEEQPQPNAVRCADEEPEPLQAERWYADEEPIRRLIRCGGAVGQQADDKRAVPQMGAAARILELPGLRLAERRFGQWQRWEAG